MVMRGAAAENVKAIIAIAGAQELPIEAPVAVRRLDLRFDDLDTGDSVDKVANYRAWAQRRWAAETGRALTPPSMEDARADRKSVV